MCPSLNATAINKNDVTKTIHIPVVTGMININALIILAAMFNTGIKYNCVINPNIFGKY